ncbi:uncharacterized protein LOC127881675 [Dreissena polymorpha]|uniref:Uncharacterized protein n=1 Tax=Dreissena polymorpha TaxID=45954 RepID=A0A9D4GTL4_DREPO|nr:uncharacterized protein LOC127881675 [Dreissena polymorpha]KAH3819722.1 hypothetical protein DPMN_121465 [Dreissena polymorpha]
MRILISILSILIGGCHAASFICRDEKTGNFAFYENEKEKCLNGVVQQKTTQITTKISSSSTTYSSQSTSTIIPPLLKHMCTLGKDLLEGYECCGWYIPFQPEFEACCKVTMTKTMVHSGKPDKDYTCCRDDITRAYKRTDLPCAYHPANNDQFWNALRVTALLKSRRLLNEACRTKTVYYGRVKFVNKTSAIYSDLKIRLNKLDLKSPTLKRQDTNLDLYIEKDRHRPDPSKLHGKYFLIITENQKPAVTPSYINVKNDVVYKLAKSHRRSFEKLRKLFALCKSLLN